MTHTLHRRGSPESLQKDFVILVMTAKGINETNSVPKIKKFFEIILQHDPINFGEVMQGNRNITTSENILNSLNLSSVPHGVFNNPETVKNVLCELKEANIGLSVVVSGDMEIVNKCCKDANLEAHTIEYSLGIWGDNKKMPPADILQISTMCGHSMVSINLVKNLLNQVKKNKKTVEEAAKILSKPCRCGVFNPDRAADLLVSMLSKKT